jgi:hypothetical protein
MNGHPSTSQGTTKELDIHLFASYEIGHPSIQVEFAWLFLDIHRIGCSWTSTESNRQVGGCPRQIGGCPIWQVICQV